MPGYDGQALSQGRANHEVLTEGPTHVVTARDWDA